MANHLLMSNVNCSFENSRYKCLLNGSDDIEVVAKWSDGLPIVAIKKL